MAEESYPINAQEDLRAYLDSKTLEAFGRIVAAAAETNTSDTRERQRAMGGVIIAAADLTYWRQAQEAIASIPYAAASGVRPRELELTEPLLEGESATAIAPTEKDVAPLPEAVGESRHEPPRDLESRGHLIERLQDGETWTWPLAGGELIELFYDRARGRAVFRRGDMTLDLGRYRDNYQILIDLLDHAGKALSTLQLQSGYRPDASVTAGAVKFTFDRALNQIIRFMDPLIEKVQDSLNKRRYIAHTDETLGKPVPPPEEKAKKVRRVGSA